MDATIQIDVEIDEAAQPKAVSEGKILIVETGPLAGMPTWDSGGLVRLSPEDIKRIAIATDFQLP